jgi:Ion channel
MFIAATVGFGDIAPITPEGRLVVCVSILAGVAIIPAQAANLVDAILEFQEERKRGGPRVTVTAAKAKQTETPTLLRKATSSATLKKTQEGRDDKIVVAEAQDQGIGWLGRCCLECEATDHREDASFCWSCGSKL